MSRLQVLAASAVVLVLTAGASSAAPLVGTLGVQPLGTSVINLQTGKGSYASQPTFISTGTGAFAGISGFGTIDGNFSFSTTVGQTLSPGTGPRVSFGAHTFVPDTVETLSLVLLNMGSVLTDSVALLFTGTIAGDSNPANLTLSCNSTAHSAFTCTATLASTDPVHIVEPATMAFLAASVAGLGMIRRRG